MKGQKKDFWIVLTSIVLMVGSTAVFVYKYMEKKAHNEKWKDYDECGI